MTPARIERLKIGEHLRHGEEQLLIVMLFNREVAIAFDSSEKCRFRNFIAPSHVIRLILHKAWQATSFRIPLALNETSFRLIEDRLACVNIE